MNPRVFGVEHSLQRYVVVGAITGTIAAVVGGTLGVPLLLTGFVAGAIVGWVASVPDKPGTPTAPPVHG
jgi:hypothetical protein